MATLAEIQARLRAQDEANKEREEKRQSGTSKSGGDNAQYPFWDMKIGQQATLRFLPDGNDENIFPWVERQTIELPFDGTINGEVDTTELVKIKVPCPTMFHTIIPGYKVACKITAHIRPWWGPKNGPKDTPEYKAAQKYYRKQSWLIQSLVVESPFVEENAPENPIRRVTLTKKLFDKVFKAYNGTEFEQAVHDFDQGTDFVIEKGQQGEFNNYDTSYFQRRTRSLTSEERAAIEQYGLFNLKDFVGKAPSEEDAEIQYQMFLDSVAGKPYDFAKYNSFYRPYNVKGPKTNSSDEHQSQQGSSSETPATPKDETPVQSETPAPSGEQGTSALIDRIRRNAMKTG